MGIVMNDVLFIAAIGRDALFIRVANRSDKPFTLDCNLDSYHDTIKLFVGPNLLLPNCLAVGWNGRLRKLRLGR